MTGTHYLNELHKEAVAELQDRVKQADKALYEIQHLVTRITGIDAALGQLKSLNHYVAVGPPDDPEKLADLLKDSVSYKERDLALDREDMSLTLLFGRAAEMRQQIDEFADKNEMDWQPDERMYGWTVEARLAAMKLEDDYWQQALNQFNKVLYEAVSSYWQDLKEADNAD